MDEEIIQFFKKYDLSNIEIKDMLTMAPMLTVINYVDFANNCSLLVKYGYPVEDLDILFLTNPNIFVKSNKDLKTDLNELQLKYEDIEQILKTNPNII